MGANGKPTVLICFDGSEGSAHAVDAAGRLFPGAPAVVLYVWHAPLPYGGVAYGGQIILPQEIQREIEGQASEQAHEIGKRGSALARAAGLAAEDEVREISGPTWRALLAAADDADADVIVVGSRGYGELRALMLGSTSSALAHHSRRPLVIVPAPGED